MLDDQFTRTKLEALLLRVRHRFKCQIRKRIHIFSSLFKYSGFSLTLISFRNFYGTILFSILALLQVISSTDIHCDFKVADFLFFSYQYSCTIENNLNITQKFSEIKSIQGSHEEDESIDSVTGLSIHNKKIRFMPKNIGEKLKNLIAIRITYGRLKEIHKDDLKQFTKLQYLNLDHNDIETLENDLFELHPDLILIWFANNYINSIGETTFKNLNKLKDLDLHRNSCFYKRLENPVALNIAFVKKELQKSKELQLKRQKKWILNSRFCEVENESFTDMLRKFFRRTFGLW